MSHMSCRLMHSPSLTSQFQRVMLLHCDISSTSTLRVRSTIAELMALDAKPNFALVLGASKSLLTAHGVVQHFPFVWQFGVLNLRIGLSALRTSRSCRRISGSSKILGCKM